MYRCSCNATLELKRGTPRTGSPIGLPVAFITHARCPNDLCANRVWQVVSEIDGGLYLEHTGKLIGEKVP
jgi:hypothetical protein